MLAIATSFSSVERQNRILGKTIFAQENLADPVFMSRRARIRLTAIGKHSGEGGKDWFLMCVYWTVELQPPTKARGRGRVGSSRSRERPSTNVFQNGRTSEVVYFLQ